MVVVDDGGVVGSVEVVSDERRDDSWVSVFRFGFEAIVEHETDRADRPCGS